MNGHEEGNNGFLVVIGREYGSGGRRLGKLLAKELGVPYYDKELLSRAAGDLGYSTSIFAEKDEKRPSFFRSFLSFNYGAPTASINATPMSDEKIYESQCRVIRDICSRESCVIVGRTADYVMRDHPRMVSLFIHAPIAHRAAAIIRRGETDSEKEAVAIARKRDHDRQAYYNYYTNRDGWGHANNYSLSFDSSKIADKTIIQTVKEMLGL
ncbi:MAG: cytidylate kinase-like family protein [Bacteroidales bacterium]|nr:cytidylate kinase-like family protein [Bacteroidales bacterium]MBD5302217.1 cytidylate kinase-like family protein [Bacteroides sp.]